MMILQFQTRVARAPQHLTGAHITQPPLRREARQLGRRERREHVIRARGWSGHSGSPVFGRTEISPDCEARDRRDRPDRPRHHRKTTTNAR